MSIFASRVKKTVQITDTVEVRDGDAIVNSDVLINVVLRKLSAKSLDKASDARQIRSSASVRQLGPEIVKAFNEDEPEPEEGAKPKAKKEKSKEVQDKARFQQYDRETVLTQGIESWDAIGADGKPLDLIKGLADLDVTTATFLFEEIVNLSDPPKEVRDEERAKDSGRSISS